VRLRGKIEAEAPIERFWATMMIAERCADFVRQES